MAPPQRTQRTHPGRSLLFVLVALIALYAGLFFGKGGHARTPLLGIDLRGGTTVTLQATPVGSGTVTQAQLNEAKNIISNRINGAGVSGASVETQGSRNIVVTVPGSNNGSLVDLVSRQALLSFRQVLACDSQQVCPGSTLKAAGSPTTAVPSISTSPQVSGSASTGIKQKFGNSSSSGHAKATSKASKRTSSQPDAVLPGMTDGRHTGNHSSSASPKASNSATPPATATPSSTASPSATGSPNPTASAQPAAKAPNAVVVAGPQCPNTKAESKCIVKRGSLIVASPKLSDVENAYAKLSCASVQNNPTDGNDIPVDYMLACDDAGIAYLMAPSTVTPSWSTGGVQGTQIKSASSGLDSQSAQWTVNLNLKSSGSSEYQKLTAAAAQDGQVSGGSSSPGCKTSGLGCNAVAIVLDGQVQSAPYTQPADGIPGGQAQISGNFTQKSAGNLANVLNYGSLPIRTTAGTAQTVSASLGSSQLRGGLIAGAISLALVALFALVYYRALGIVTILSLIVSGLILYSVTTMLGHSRLGYTLSLAGIAGFIVAVGITADSFVVFFERMRDEVREGRRLRSGVERAWPRARRTIISADAISLLAAVILYIVSISDVRGFAFTLGLSTLSDLFIVFFFTKPLITVMSRWSAFDRGARWTGVGRDRGRRTWRSGPPGPRSGANAAATTPALTKEG